MSANFELELFELQKDTVALDSTVQFYIILLNIFFN